MYFGCSACLQSENRCRNQGLRASYICVVGNVYAMIFSFVAMDHLCRRFSIQVTPAWYLCATLALNVLICQFSRFVPNSNRALHCLVFQLVLGLLRMINFVISLSRSCGSNLLIVFCHVCSLFPGSSLFLDATASLFFGAIPSYCSHVVGM